ncbi:MAG: GH116 family glycosyl-hydrolase [Sulfolobales archaeon]
MKIITRIDDHSSIALGGIGTGSIDLTPRGVFTAWTIFNNRPWSDYGSPEEYMSRDDFVFILRVREESRDPYLLILRTEPWFSRSNYDNYSSVNDALNPYQTPWVRNVESIEFEAKPPITSLIFRDRLLDRSRLSVEAKIYSLLVPGNLRLSSTPAIIFRFFVKNTGERSVETSILGVIRNPHNYSSNTAAINNEISSEDYKGVLLTGENIDPSHGMYRGSLALVAINSNTYVGSFTLNTRDRSRYTEPLRKLLVEYRSKGVISQEPNKVVWGSEEKLFGAVSIKDIVGENAEKEYIFILAWYYPNHIDRYGNKLGHYYENIYRDINDLLMQISREYRSIIEKIELFIKTIYEGSYEEYLKDLALSQLPTLAKSTWLTREGFFAVWEGGPGTCAGLNTVDVAYYALPTIALLYPELGRNLVFEWSKHILTPDKSPYYQLFALAYPENMYLYREALRKDPSIQHVRDKFDRTLEDIVRKTGKDPSGRVMHCYTASPYHVDTYDRNDLMPEYILQALYITNLLGDRDFLKNILDKIKLVISGTLRQHDELGLKLIYHSPPSGYEGFSHVAKELQKKGFGLDILRILMSGPMYYPVSVNTFDNLSLHGVAVFTSDLWVSSLKALVDTLKASGYGENEVEQYMKLYKEARDNYVKLLWNGEYFDNWYDPVSGLRDRALMSASLSGQWYLKQLMSLDYSIDRGYVVSTLRNIYKNNYRDLEGLLNATYPDQPRPALAGELRYPNETNIVYAIGSQPDTPWTGIEIPVALQMIWEGMISEGLEILRNVHERYSSWGMYWNHMECDGHYFRALVSMQILNHLAGFAINSSHKFLYIDPKYPPKNFVGAVLLPSSIALLRYDSSDRELVISIENRLGDSVAEFNRIITRSNRKPSSVEVLLNNERIGISKIEVHEDRRIEVEMLRSIRLREGDILRIYLKYE